MQMSLTGTDLPFELEGTNRPGPWVVTCDHASNYVPPWVNDGDLGLPPEDMERHIAYDPGAEGLTRHLARLLDSPAIYGRFSRLVIDPNRGEDDPTLLMKLYDGSIIPGNRFADAEELERRLSRLYRPYHDALSALCASREAPAICAIHSFTPQLRGRPPRPWEVGILFAEDERISRPLIEACRAQGWCVGENEPYGGHLPGDSIDRHAIAPGRPNVLIELRNDLIADDAAQAMWAERLAPLMEKVLEESGL